MEITVDLYEPPKDREPNEKQRRTDSIKIDIEIVSCRITKLVTGNGGMAIGLKRIVNGRAYGGFSRSPIIKDWGLAVARLHGQTIGEGQIDHVQLGADSLPSGFVASPYSRAATEDLWFQTADTIMATAGQLLFEAVRGTTAILTTPPFGTDDFQDSQISHDPQAWNGKTLSAIINEITQEGFGGGVPIDIGVWNDRTLKMKPRKQPIEPTYHVPWEDPPRLDVQRITADMIAAAAVRYTPFGGKPQITQLSDEVFGFRENYGRVKAELIEDSVIGEPTALNLQNLALATKGKPVMACHLERSENEGILFEGGQECHPALVSPWRWLKIGNLEQFFFITTVDWDAYTGRLTVDGVTV